MKSLIATVFIALTVFSLPCISAPTYPDLQQAQELHNSLLSKFTYVKQTTEDTFIEWTGFEEAIEGDCDDYYAAAFNQIAYKGWPVMQVQAVSKRSGDRHVMACTRNRDGLAFCLDNEFKKVQKWFQVRKKYTNIKKGKWKFFTFLPDNGDR